MALGNLPSFRVVKCSLPSTLRHIRYSSLQLSEAIHDGTKRACILVFARLCGPWVVLSPVCVAEKKSGTVRCRLHDLETPLNTIWTRAAILQVQLGFAERSISLEYCCT